LVPITQDRLVEMLSVDWSRDDERWEGGKKVAGVRNEREKCGTERHKEHER